MPKKPFFAVLLAVISIVALTALFNIRPAKEPSPESLPDSEETTILPEAQPAESIYEIKLSGEAIWLYTFDESGAEISKKSIDYIDVYSLYQSQIDILRAGARFSSREAAAEFIQDLGS